MRNAGSKKPFRDKTQAAFCCAADCLLESIGAGKNQFATLSLPVRPVAFNKIQAGRISQKITARFSGVELRLLLFVDHEIE